MFSIFAWPASRGRLLVRPVVLLLALLFAATLIWPDRRVRVDALQPRAGLMTIPARRGLAQSRLYLTKSGDTYWGIARRYGLSPVALMQANPDYRPDRLPIGVWLRLPEANAGSSQPSQPGWRWPVDGRVTSRYGWRWGRMHRGMDIAPPAGTTIRAAGEGRVSFAGWRSGYGLLVILAHASGWRTFYAHNSCLYVHAGQWVQAGAALARVGATGNATGIHLHFEIIGPAGHIDPLQVLK